MVLESAFSQAQGQGWAQAADLVLAFGLASVIGLEREIRQRSAGLRTYTLVGFGSALIMLVSKYGFTDVLSPHTVALDPSRIAAQIVTGIGFIGGGLIFVRRDVVRGLTTAAAVWLTAGIGMACGAGLPLLALGGAGGYFVVVFAYTPLIHRLPGATYARSHLTLEYTDGRGVLRTALATCSSRGYSVADLAVARGDDDESRGRDRHRDRTEAGAPGAKTVRVTMTLQGPRDTTSLVSALADLPDVTGVGTGDLDAD
jgi:putative Mg2+ transporter-C (MgtC) family protein